MALHDPLNLQASRLFAHRPQGTEISKNPRHIPNAGTIGCQPFHPSDGSDS
jgi:hypothetical protein